MTCAVSETRAFASCGERLAHGDVDAAVAGVEVDHLVMRCGQVDADVAFANRIEDAAHRELLRMDDRRGMADGAALRTMGVAAADGYEAIALREPLIPESDIGFDSAPGRCR